MLRNILDTQLKTASTRSTSCPVVSSVESTSDEEENTTRATMTALNASTAQRPTPALTTLWVEGFDNNDDDEQDIRHHFRAFAPIVSSICRTSARQTRESTFPRIRHTPLSIHPERKVVASGESQESREEGSYCCGEEGEKSLSSVLFWAVFEDVSFWTGSCTVTRREVLLQVLVLC
eukprot:scaffold22799_cov83-Skeletonema_dohrnii-CCMP3373.AAC.2